MVYSEMRGLYNASLYPHKEVRMNIDTPGRHEELTV